MRSWENRLGGGLSYFSTILCEDFYAHSLLHTLSPTAKSRALLIFLSRLLMFSMPCFGDPRQWLIDNFSRVLDNLQSSLSAIVSSLQVMWSMGVMAR